MYEYYKNGNNWVVSGQEDSYEKFKLEPNNSKNELYVLKTIDNDIYNRIYEIQNNMLKTKTLEFITLFKSSLKEYIKDNDCPRNAFPLNFEIGSDSVDIYWRSEYSGIYFSIYLDKISWFYTAVSDQETMSRAGTIHELNNSVNVLKERISEMLRC